MIPGLFGRNRGGPFGARAGARVFEPGALRLVVLAMIADAPRHGYEIIKDLWKQFHGAYAPSPGSIYPMLKMLEEMGLVVSTSFGPRRRFTITEFGSAYLEQNRAELAAIHAQLAEAAAPMERESLGEAVRGLRGAVFAKMRGTLSEASAEKLRDILVRARREIEEL
jgi:DNA-binding PadR family transcriptional regulator